jgi:hypothetical protein
VEWRSRGADIQAFLPKSKYDGAPDNWVTVPVAIIHHNENPTGRAVACWSAVHDTNKGWYCFWLPDLT